jgi:hypothetical protein
LRPAAGAAGAAGTGGAVQPAPQEEVYEYYAPFEGRGGARPGNEEAVAAAREVYGFFSPTLAPRLGDVVRARPGAET